jgi:DNA-binding NarL/FixJ family response regulator
MTPYRILLAEDHALFREGIKMIIKRDPGLEVVGEVGDGLDLLECLKKTTPDMIILDITMPNLQGLDALKEIKTSYPDIKVLVLTMHKSKGHLLLAFSAGADGYLLKENSYNDLFAAIEKIRQGSHYISSLVSNQVIDLFRQEPGKLFPRRDLSPRERSVLKLISQGKTSKQIAEQLSISLPTVQTHRTNLKKKLDINTNAGLIKYAIQKGYALAEDN